MLNQTIKQVVNGVVPAQVLYDLREEIGFCSGTDLHEFFSEVIGEPSPSGYAEIPSQAAYDLACTSAAGVAWNNGGDWGYFENTEKLARKKFQPADTGTSAAYYKNMRTRYEGH